MDKQRFDEYLRTKKIFEIFKEFKRRMNKDDKLILDVGEIRKNVRKSFMRCSL